MSTKDWSLLVSLQSSQCPTNTPAQAELERGTLKSGGGCMSWATLNAIDAGTLGPNIGKPLTYCCSW